MNYKFSCLLFISLLCFYSNLLSQHNNFKIFSNQEGLPNSSIYKITQDSRGIIWLGTQGGGLVRFQGDKFISYTINDGLNNNSIREIYEDHSGNLWIGTETGLNLFNGIEISGFDQFEELSESPVLSIVENTEGQIFVATRDYGVIRLTFPEKDSISIQKIDEEYGLSTNFVFDLYVDKYNRIWAGTFGGGIDVISFENDSAIIQHLIPGLNLPGAQIIFMTESTNKENLWISTLDAGVCKINITEDLSGKVAFLSEVNNLHNEKIWSIYCDSEGMTWFGTQSGVLRISEYNNQIQSVNYELPGNLILDIFEDHEANIWLSSFGNGLCKYYGDHFAHYTEDDGLTNKLVTDIERDKSGNLLISTNGGGINKINTNASVLNEKYFSEIKGLKSNFINDMTFDKSNNLWLATSDKGIAHLQNGKISYLTKDNGLVNNYINILLIDSKDRLWCGTRGGISIYNNNGFFNITETNEWELINNEVQDIIEDKAGNVWVATLGGLAKFFSNTMQDFDEVEGLSYLKLQSLAEDIQGNIWIGTFGGGIFRFNVNPDSDKPIELVADNTSLSSNNINSLIFFNDTTLIAGLDVGFEKIILDDSMNIVSIKSYGLSEGLLGTEFQLNAAFKDNNNQLWFGTTKGLTRYNPKLEKPNKNPPVPILTDIDLFYEKVDWKTETDSINPWFLTPRNPIFPHSKNHFTFKFSGLSFSNPGKVYYKYKLEGVDEEWSPNRYENQVTYSGLNPGHYKFSLIAFNENNIPSEPLIYSFRIKPPFYKTWWFISLNIILLVIIIIRYIKFREQQLQRKNKELEIKVEERTVEIRMQKEIIEEKNRDITDSINYAKSIQDALLPSYELLKRNVSDFFILFKPRDIVSGDFYWVSDKKNKLIVTAADCTGHGIPGAFMSLLGMTFLNEIVNNNNIHKPGNILDQLREYIIKSLKQSGNESESKDGMDIALCTIDKKSNTLQFSGGNNPLYLIRNKELLETRADRMPAAIHYVMNDFTTHEMELKKGDMFYMFSDGYADQFGGPDNKKFKTKNFKELLVNLADETMETQKEILNQKFEEWRGDCEQVDDVIVIGIKY